MATASFSDGPRLQAMLSAQRGLDTSLHAQINERKQAHTVELLTDVHESSALVAVFRHFKQLGFPASRAAVRLHWLAASERACAAVGRRAVWSAWSYADVCLRLRWVGDTRDRGGEREGKSKGGRAPQWPRFVGRGSLTWQQCALCALQRSTTRCNAAQRAAARACGATRAQIAVASNCVRASIVLILTKLGVMPFVDTYLSNQARATPATAARGGLRALPTQCGMLQGSVTRYNAAPCNTAQRHATEYGVLYVAQACAA